MKKLYVAGAALALSTTAAYAGGLDRSGQNVGIIFEKDNVLEFSVGSVRPTVSGTFGGGAISTGDIAEDYSQMSVGYKHNFNDQLSLSLIVDQPFGADVQYPTLGGPLAGLSKANAQVKSNAITALARYKFNDRVSVHGGIYHQSIQMNVGLVNNTYTAVGAKASDIGYVLGAAYEIPDIAARVALTYRSETDYALDTTEVGVIKSVTPVTMPKSVNLDFQTGIAANTLLFGQVRWVDWTSTRIVTANGRAANPLVSYKDDAVTLTVGVARKFSDQWSGAVSVGYEDAKGGRVANLGPTDGKKSVSLAAIYNAGNGLKVTGGVSYVKIGNAVSGAGGTFNDNKAVGLGLKVSKSF